MNIQESTPSQGKLYLVSTPIGNKDDITLRAINTIKRCDIVVCEEIKMGALTLKNLNLSKEMISLNENNESEMTSEIINLLRNGQKIALISDAGTPIFADPGLYLVRQAISNNIDIEVVPGVSSIMTAIIRSGFELYEFLYAGFLPRKNEERDRKLQKLARERRTVVVFETPYRLNSLLEALARILPNRKAYIGMNLTMVYESHHYGTFSELFKKFENSKTKSEFIIVMEGDKEWLENRNIKAQQNNDEDFDNEIYDDDDDEPVVYEYPVKAHQKTDFDNRKATYNTRPFSSTAGGNRYKKSNTGTKDRNYSKDKPRRDDRSSFRRDRDFQKRDDRSSFGKDRDFQKRDDRSSFGKDRTPKGAPNKFKKDIGSSSFSDKKKFGKFDKKKSFTSRKFR